MERLKAENKLLVRQKKEWGEILTGFETKNKYVIMNAQGEELFYAAEVGGSLLLRLLLKAFRPFKMSIMTKDGKQLLHLVRPFRFFFHRLNIYDQSGAYIGAIQKRFSILRRIYGILNPSEQECVQLFGPILHPWTFIIKKNGRDEGKITKRWSGLFKEGFTDADNFEVMLPVESSLSERCLILGAVFLIDFVHFENKSNN